MSNVKIKKELYESITALAAAQEIKVEDLVNGMLGREMRTGSDSAKDCSPDINTIEKLLLVFIKFDLKDRRRFIALYDQMRADPANCDKLVEQLKKQK